MTRITRLLLGLIVWPAMLTAHHATAHTPHPTPEVRQDTLPATARRTAAFPIRPGAPAPSVADTLRPDSLLTDSLTDECEDCTDSIAPNEPLAARVRRLMDNDIFQRTQVGVYIYDLTADTLVYAQGERQCLRPASNEKLVTAITALHVLGTDYRYRTRLLATELKLGRDSVWNGRLIVQGGYDPLLDADDLRAMAESLLSRGISRLNAPVTLDLSFKDSKRWGWGWCWDDDETPLTPLLFQGTDTFVQHLRQAFAEAGISWDGTTFEGHTPPEAELLCERTHTIDQALLPMMKQSDNAVAESLFYQLAAWGGHRQAGRKQAVAHIQALIRQVGLDPAHYQVADGSGLSLYNYLTPELLGRLLRYAYRQPDIYRHLLPSLPLAGHDGTLRRRMRGTRAEANVQAKTGTVEGVSTLSGYLTTAGGNRLCFSIMNQGVRHTATGHRFQDRLCRALCQ